mgnify:CR=1 FL=1
MKEIKKERNVGLDALRILAMLMIVALHYINRGGLLERSNNNDFYYVLYNAIYALSRIAVNCYVLISGYFFSKIRI